LATASGSGYRIRVVSDDPIVTGTDNGADITISASSVCPLPVSVNISDITTTTALVSWTGNASASSYRIRKRPVGTTTWIYSSVTAPVTSKTLSNNIPATNYEVQLQTYCNVAKTDSSGYTASVNFTSASACTGTSSVSTTGTTASAATLNWTYTSAPSKWTIKYRVSATSTWTTVNISGSLTSYVLNSLTASTNYDWKIRAKCGSEHSDFSAVQHFTTSSSRLAEVMSENSFSIYPNPAKEEISLQLAVGSTYPVSIRVYDLNGKEMATWLNDQMTEGMHTLSFNVASFAKGIYFVRMISGNGIQNQKLIVQ
ncbi:MAG TPA: fibronectin type III domain-containing protein, partial [Chitinophagales bacterium]|nr:fibronectin type III domain-containing protein [Chitinophagales bacterium]